MGKALHAIFGLALLEEVAMSTIQRLTQRVHAEYLEMPGLRLTSAQVQRLCGIERAACERVLQELVDAKFLCVKPDGQYARLTEGCISRPRAAKASLHTKSPSAKAS
jgi:hypothetical protein